VASPLPELPLEDQFFLATQRGAPVELTALRNGRALKVELAPAPDPREGAAKPILGLGVISNHVAALRPHPVLEALGLAPDDRLELVNGRPILRPRDLELALALAPERIALRVLRDGRRLELEAPGLDRAAALDLARHVALAPDVETNRILVTEGSAAAAAGLQDGDRILRADGSPVATWDDITEHTRRAAKRGSTLALSVERALPDGSSQLLSVSAEPEPWHPPYYGVFLRPALYEYRAASLGEAVRVGLQGSWKFLTDAWSTVKRMLLGQVSAQNVGGIISIGVVSYSWASLGVAKLLFFLCMLSMNLAFLNVLPIPVLDGGHLLFLLIEKIKGSPVSERVLGYGQLVGIVLILSLMVFVTFNDLRRWTDFFQP
jgi:regulator of sigma E protease